MDHLGIALFYQPVAIIGCSSALPHDGGIDGLSGGPVPYHRSLPLVGDPNRLDVVCGQIDFGHGFQRDADYRILPDHYAVDGEPDL